MNKVNLTVESPTMFHPDQRVVTKLGEIMNGFISI